MGIRLLSNKHKVGNAQAISIIIVGLLYILNLGFIIHLGRPSTAFLASSPTNYLTLFAIKFIYQILHVLFSVWFVYIFYFIKRSTFISVSPWKKAIVILFLLFANLPTVYVFSLVPIYQKGTTQTDTNYIQLYTKKFHQRNNMSYSYRNYIKVNNKEFELSDPLFDLLDCPKGSKNTEWIYVCKKGYRLTYLDFDEGLLDITPR